MDPSRIRHLTKKEILLLIPPKTIPKVAQRDRAKLEVALQTLSPSILEAIGQAGDEATKLKEKKELGKRKRDTETRRERTKARKVDEAKHDISKFLDLPTEDQRKERHAEFLARTSDEALRVEVCVSCAREMEAKQGTEWQICNIPNRQLLKSKYPHDKHVTHNGLLLVEGHVKGHGESAKAWFCVQCTNALTANRLPPLALANRMWIGEVPKELSDLTLPEQLLIAQHYPRCFVVKLYPKDGARDPSMLQSGMRGNVSSYENNIPDVAKMVEGDLLPQKPEILASVLAVAFIGSGPLPKAWLKSTFRVRREYVHRALLWLKEHNPHYHDLQLDANRLASLPEDDVPDVILATMRQEMDGQLAEREEGGGYVPKDTDEAPMEPGDSALKLNQHQGQWAACANYDRELIVLCYSL